MYFKTLKIIYYDRGSANTAYKFSDFSSPIVLALSEKKNSTKNERQTTRDITLGSINWVQFRWIYPCNGLKRDNKRRIATTNGLCVASTGKQQWCSQAHAQIHKIDEHFCWRSSRSLCARTISGTCCNVRRTVIWVYNVYIYSQPSHYTHLLLLPKKCGSEAPNNANCSLRMPPNTHGAGILNWMCAFVVHGFFSFYFPQLIFPLHRSVSSVNCPSEKILHLHSYCFRYTRAPSLSLFRLLVWANALHTNHYQIYGSTGMSNEISSQQLSSKHSPRHSSVFALSLTLRFVIRWFPVQHSS